MPTRDSERRFDWFTRLDRAFWVVWLLFALLVVLAYRQASDPGAAFEVMPGRADCRDLLPHPARMSTAGRTIYWLLFAFQLSIYVVLLTVLHRIIHRFARRQVFVAETLERVWFMGLVLIAWPFLEAVVGYSALALLKWFGDLPGIKIPVPTLDVGPLAVGLFLIAIKYVLEQAIALKTDNDLTV